MRPSEPSVIRKSLFIGKLQIDGNNHLLLRMDKNITMKKIKNSLILILIGCFIGCHTQLIAQKVQFPDIAKELKTMRDEEQKGRIKWAKMAKKGKTESDKFYNMTIALIEGDRRNTARMQEIVKQIGWPTFDKVGEGPSNNAWLLVQHADRNPRFQKRCLELMKTALDEGQVNPANYAFLYDRAHVNHGFKQLYATQSSTNNGIMEGTFHPLDDESNVQKRRAEMGIDQNVVDYAKGYGFEYSIPSPTQAEQRAAIIEERYRDNIQKAKAAMDNQQYDVATEHYKIALACHGYTETADYVAGARALALSKDKASNLGITWLIKALCRGYADYDQFDSSTDFEYLKKDSPFNWIDLENLLKEVRAEG